MGFIIDVMGMLLLAAVIFYTIRLNQHFQMLQKNRAELARQLSGFAHSTDRAEAAIQQVRQSTRDSAQQMEDLLQKAETLKADLGYLVERSTTLADRLEGGVRRDREQEGTGTRASRRARGGRVATPITEEPVLRGEQPPARTSRRAAKASARVEEQPETASASEQERPSTELSTSRRRRRGGRSEGASGDDSDSNSELLKVLQGMR